MSGNVLRSRQEAKGALARTSFLYTRGGENGKKTWLSHTLRKVLPFQLDYSKNSLIFHKIKVSFL